MSPVTESRDCLISANKYNVEPHELQTKNHQKLRAPCACIRGTRVWVGGSRVRVLLPFGTRDVWLEHLRRSPEVAGARMAPEVWRLEGEGSGGGLTTSMP